MESERYFSDPVAAVKTVRSFLGADRPESFDSDDVRAAVNGERNSRARGRHPSGNTVERLEALFRPYNEMLAHVLARHGLGNVSWAQVNNLS